MFRSNYILIILLYFFYSTYALDSLQNNNATRRLPIISRTEGVSSVYYKKVFSKYNITKEIPKMFMEAFPLGLNVINNTKEEYMLSNTTKITKCYNKLPLYSIIVGLLERYNAYLSLGYRMGACEVKHTIHDGSFYGDLEYLIHVNSNKIEEIQNELEIMKRKCYLLESKSISLSSIYDQVNLSNYDMNDPKLVKTKDSIERAHFTKMLTSYENLLVKKKIAFEKNCQPTKDRNSECYLLNYECVILEESIERMITDFLEIQGKNKRKLR